MALVRCQGYGAEVGTALAKGFDLLGGIGPLVRNKSVTVKLNHDAHDVVFEVTDTGIGVPKAQQKQLFTKFYRADNARHVRPDGTGLGIYLAKRVLDDHHAELIFKSKEGEGSTFGFKFPIKSKLATKRVTAPEPKSGNGTPAIGELAAGIGVSAEALKATLMVRTDKPAFVRSELIMDSSCPI